MKTIVSPILLFLLLSGVGIGSTYAIGPLGDPVSSANKNPTWYVDERCFLRGAPGEFDGTAVKDPSIVFYNGKYHLFYTGVTKEGWWQTGYAAAETIPGLKDAKHVFLDTLKEGYFCAPQVFYFEPQKKWYLIYNDGNYGGAYATTTNIEDPKSWRGPRRLISGTKNYDFVVICDDQYAYLFCTESGDSRNIISRRTTLDKFPSGWSAPTVVATDTFEAVLVYKSLSDGKYYLLPEDDKNNRYYELWTADNLNGPWNKITEEWASQSNLEFTGEHWTDNVSHGEILRSGFNQKLEISDINRADFLIQGLPNGNYPDYAHIPWDLGIIRNYKK